jgi:hypothetical protein
MSHLINPADMNTIQLSIENMIALLDDAVVEARYDHTLVVQRPVARVENIGGGGRGHLEIDRNWLAYASQVQTLQAIANELQCHPRSVRHHLLDYELAEPAPPVIQYTEHPDRTRTKEWCLTGPTMSVINNDPQALDALVGRILGVFPNYGIQYLAGAVRSEGYRVSRAHIWESYHRVMGLRPRFMHPPVERRVYSVPSVNSLWHHNGNHSKHQNLLSFPQSEIDNRVDQMEVCGAWIHRRQIPFYNWDAMQYKQPVRNCLVALQRCYRAAWSSKSGTQ